MVPPPLLVSVHDLLPQPWTWSTCGQREPKSLLLLQQALCRQALNGHKENRGRSTNKGQRYCGQSSSFSLLPLKSNEFQGGCPHNAMVPHTPLSSHFPLLPGETPKIKRGALTSHSTSHFTWMTIINMEHVPLKKLKFVV